MKIVSATQVVRPLMTAPAVTADTPITGNARQMIPMKTGWRMIEKRGIA